MRGPRNILNAGGGDTNSTPPPQAPKTQTNSKSPPTNKKSHTTKTKQKSQVVVNQVKGVVRSVTSTCENKGKFRRLMESMAGHDYSRDGEINVIQIDYLSNNQSCQVVIYGHVSNGLIQCGNTITVVGKFDSYNRFVAKSIVNDSTNSQVPISGKISRTVILSIPLFFSLLLVVLAMSGSLTSLISATLSISTKLIAVVVMILILLLVLKRMIFRR